jgi:chromosome segregation ATPase
MEVVPILSLIAGLKDTTSQLMAEALVAPSEEVAPTSDKIPLSLEAARRGSRALAALKSLNTKTWLALESSREAVQKENAQSDAHNLSLENLLYEKASLSREVARCRELMTPELDKIPLPSNEELIATNAVLDADGLPVVMEGNEHETTKRKLKYELQERRKLEKLLEEKRKELATLREANLKKKQFIEALPLQIKEVQTTLQSLYEPMFGKLGQEGEEGSSSSSASSAGSNEVEMTSSGGANTAAAGAGAGKLAASSSDDGVAAGSKRKQPGPDGSAAAGAGSSAAIPPPAKRQNTTQSS